MAESGQLEQFIERTSSVRGPEETEPKAAGGQPRVPFSSNYVLTREQEDNLVDHAIKRLGQLEGELGRDRVVDPAWWEKNNEKGMKDRASETFMGKRARFEAIFHNDVEWRRWVLGGIFAESNLVVPMARRICRQMISRAQNYFFSTDPWFAGDPEGIEDKAMAEKIDRYVKWKARMVGMKRSMERAVKGAFVRGELVLKTTHLVRDTIFETTQSVLVDVKGQPIMAEDGDYIFETDEWVKVDMANPEVKTGVVKRAVGSIMGWEVLKRDGRTPKPSAPIWVPKAIKRRQVLFSGPETEPVYYKDFLCPLTARSVQEADLAAHLYDKPVMELVDLYVKRGMMDDSTPDRIKAVERTVDLIRQLSNNSAQPKSGSAQAGRPNDDDEQRQATAQPANTEPIVEVAECYLWYDANGDGILENIMLVLDRHNRVPIYYEYVANVTPDGERPFDVVRVNEVDGRWYGVGCMEMFDTTQEIADLLVNRWNFSQSRSGRIDFWDPAKTYEGERTPGLLLNWGGTYTLKPNVKPDEVLHSVYLNDTKFDAIKAMLEFFLQVAMNESGVQHANDSLVTGMDSQKLATGIRNIEKAGQEIFAPFLADLEPGLESALNRAMLVLFANLDRKEVFTYLNGDTKGIDSIKPEEVRGLKLNVSLLLTRYKGEQTFQQMLQASDVVQAFYTLDPLVQERVAPFYRTMLKALDQKIDADVIIAPLPVQMPTAGAPVKQTPGATKPEPAGKSAPNL